MRRGTFISLLLIAAAASSRADDKITYQDHIKPIFTTSCASCHNPDKNKAGLDLTT